MTTTFEERTRTRGWLPMAAYSCVLVVLLLVSWQVTTHFVEDPQGLPDASFTGDDFLDGWVRYDGGWYLGIAAQGYDYTPGRQSSVAFFPGYPLSIRAVGDVVGDPMVGGVLVTIACGLAAVILFWRWCGDRMALGAATTALALLTLYPYGWYLYGAVYGDAMFLLSALGAFVLLERDRPVLAGLAGFVATATRSVGLAVALGLMVRAVERRGGLTETGRWGFPRRVELRRLEARDYGVLLSVGGVMAFGAFLWREFGDPFLFSSVQKYWDRPRPRAPGSSGPSCNRSSVETTGSTCTGSSSRPSSPSGRSSRCRSSAAGSAGATPRTLRFSCCCRRWGARTSRAWAGT